MDSAKIDSHWNFSDPQASETAFRGLLASESEPEVRRQIATQIVRALGLQRRFEEGHALLDSVTDPDVSALSRVRIELERGRLFNSAGEPSAARRHFEMALQLADEAGEDYYAVDAAHMLGIANPPDEQIKWNLEAMRLAEAAESPRARGWLGSLYNNIGWSLHELGRHHEALELFEKALEWRQEAGKEPGLRIARWTVARQLRELGRVEEALTCQRGILTDYGEEVSGYVYEELGECLFALGRRDEAAPHFGRAYEMLSQDDWMRANESERIERLNTLSAG